VNNTLTGNTADQGGGLAVFLTGNGAAAEVANSVIWGSTATDCGRASFLDGDADGDLTFAPVLFRHNDIDAADAVCATDPGFGLDGSNIRRDPLFSDPAGADFHLTLHSPVIDRGDAAVAGLPPGDIDGNSRVIGWGVDMGADEYVALAGPDLLPLGWTLLAVGDVVGTGDGIIAGVRVANMGSQPITQAFVVRFYLSLDEWIDPSDRLLGSRRIENAARPFSPGQERRVKFMVHVPGPLASGQHVVAVVDADDAVVEMVEANNTLTGTLP
jgi:hypothetical protein